MKNQNAIIFSIPKMDNLSGNYLRNNMLIFKIICLPSQHLHLLNSICTNICPNNSPKKNLKNISSLHKSLRKNLPENRLRLLWLIIILIKKEIKSITSGIASIFVRKIKKKKKLLSLDAILNLMSVILLLISSMIKMVLSSVFSSLEDAVLMVLIAVFITESLTCKTVN